MLNQEVAQLQLHGAEILIPVSCIIDLIDRRGDGTLMIQSGGKRGFEIRIGHPVNEKAIIVRNAVSLKGKPHLTFLSDEFY